MGLFSETYQAGKKVEISQDANCGVITMPASSYVASTGTTTNGTNTGTFTAVGRERFTIEVGLAAITNGAGAALVTTVAGKPAFDFKVVNAWVITSPTAVGSSVVTVRNGSNAITSTISTATNSGLIRATTIDTTYSTVLVADTLTIATSTQNQPACTVYIDCVRL